MKRAVLLLVIGGCDLSEGERAMTGECPESSCSDTTPSGLHFYGEAISHGVFDDLIIDGPGTTAAGGIQHVAIGGLNGAPFRAVTDGTTGISVELTTGETVTIRGTGDGSDYLRIVDPVTSELYDRKRLSGAAITAITLEPIESEVGIPDTPWAFKDLDSIAVALWGIEIYNDKLYLQRLVDSSMTMTLPTDVTRAAWDAINIPTAVGEYTLTVKAGNYAAKTLTARVVDAIDSVEAYDPPSELYVDQLAYVCFHGLAAGRPVAGLTWEFTIDLHMQQGDSLAGNNCAWVVPTIPGPLDITASTEGRRLTLHLSVVAAAPRIDGGGSARAPRTSSAGDRATFAW